MPCSTEQEGRAPTIIEAARVSDEVYDGRFDPGRDDR